MSVTPLEPVTGDLTRWPQLFANGQIDFVPDPMLLRVGDLFIGGESGTAMYGLEAGPVWETIEKNIDALAAFFHVLMTRERIPLIDYEMTFPSGNLVALGNLAVPCHPDFAQYVAIKEHGRAKIRELDLSKLPDEAAHALAEELRTVGYQWYPDPDDPKLTGDRRTVATFLLGGLIFNEYAKVSHADHLLQTARAQLFLALMVEPDLATTHVAGEERKLFDQLDKVVNNDEHLRKKDVSMPPSVLPYLLARKPKSPRHLLELALELREETDWKKYRQWYRKLRAAWVEGSYDEGAEYDLVAVANEIALRYKSSQYRSSAPAVWSTEIGLKGSVGPNLGAAEAKLEVGLGTLHVSMPNGVRDWLTETVRFRNHRKVLLRMGLAQRRYRNLALALHNLWAGRRKQS